MSDIRYNQWLHNSGTGGVSQDAGGNIGIGTTAPLIPVGAGNTTILNVGVVTANYIYGTVQGAIEGTLDDWIVHAGDTNTKFGFLSDDVFEVHTAGTERIRIEADGHTQIGGVGLSGGNDHGLTVTEPGGTANVLELATTNANGRINFSRNLSSTLNTTSYIQWGEPGAQGTGDLKFGTSPASNSPVDRLHILSGGGVGIGASLYHLGDTNTFLNFGNDTMTLKTGGSTRIYLDNNYPTWIRRDAAGIHTTAMLLNHATNASGNGVGIAFAPTQNYTSRFASIEVVNQDGNNNMYMAFKTVDSSQGAHGIERLRILSTGQLYLGSTQAPKGSAAGSMDLDNGNITMCIGGNENSTGRTNSTNKLNRISSPHYTNAEEPVALISSYNVSNQNIISYGGGSGQTNAVTKHSFYTGPNTTSTTGVERVRISSDGTWSRLLDGSTTQAAFGGTGQINGITGTPSMAATPFVVGRDTGSTRSAWFGGHLRFSSGYGIDFSETADGPSVGSEIFDDYERGGWTGVITTGGGNVGNAWYIKIGDMVFVTGNCTAWGNTTSSNAIQVTGLPFSANATGYGQVVFCKHADAHKGCWVEVSGTTLQFLKSSTGTGSCDYMYHSGIVQSSGSASFSVWYRTAA